jgi:hypothetical protein
LADRTALQQRDKGALRRTIEQQDLKPEQRMQEVYGEAIRDQSKVNAERDSGDYTVGTQYGGRGQPPVPQLDPWRMDQVLKRRGK